MYLDVFTISALVDEFMGTIVGGRIQDVIDVDEIGIGLEIYWNHRRHYLYMNADHNAPRIHLMPDKLRRGLQHPTQLGLLLRRYVEGGQLRHISQPQYERVLHLHIAGTDGEVEIVIEPMERRSNILLIKEGIILDCVRRIGPEANRYRLSLPNHEYVAPPPQTGKRDPATITAQDIVRFTEQITDKKHKSFQLLTGRLLGISPLLAREIVFQASGNEKQKTTDADPTLLFNTLNNIIAPLLNREWQPGIINEEGIIQAYSVYPVTYLPGWQHTETLNTAMSQYYGAPVGTDAYNRAKQPVQAAIDEAKAKTQAKLNALEKSITDDAEREILRKSGELILAYQYTLEEGQAELRAQYDPDEPELVIKISPNQTPLENAQRYFNRYEKAKRAFDDVPGLIESTQLELVYLAQLESDLELASNWPEIDNVQQELQNRGYWKGEKAKYIARGGQSAPIRVVTKDAYVIWVGRNSRQNEMVTFKKAKSDDFWLHARDVPGAHVIIKNDGRNIPDEVIEQAASIAAYYSKLRAEVKAPVDVTRIKYVKKIKGAGQGMVTYRNEKTHLVVPHHEKHFEENA